MPSIEQPKTTQPNAYLRTKVMTAGPAELRLMLFDGALKFAEQGKQGLVDADHEASYEGISRCQAIVMELINSLDPDADPQLCERLRSLYTFMFTTLMEASQQRDPTRVDDVIDLLRYERQTWALLLEKLCDENAAASTLLKTPDASPTIPGSGAAPTTDALIGGSVSVEA